VFLSRLWVVTNVSDDRIASIFYPEDGSGIFLRNVGNYLQDYIVSKLRNHGAAVAQAVQCLTTGWTIGVRSLAGAKDFSSSPCVQTGSGAHPAYNPMGTERGKARPGRDADHSSPSSVEVKYE
jgi:hypothetical protein